MISRDGKKAKPGTPLIDRLMLHVDIDPNSSCWIWTAARDVNGYGRIQVDHKLRYAHRASYEVHVGPVPTGLDLDHLCRNRACCRPTHLDPVTPQVNIRRGESVGARARRRSDCLYGHPYEEHGFIHKGRRSCRLCQRVYSSLWRALPHEEIQRRKQLGIKVVDLAAHFAQQSLPTADLDLIARGA